MSIHLPTICLMMIMFSIFVTFGLTLRFPIFFLGTKKSLSPSSYWLWYSQLKCLLTSAIIILNSCLSYKQEFQHYCLSLQKSFSCAIFWNCSYYSTLQLSQRKEAHFQVPPFIVEFLKDILPAGLPQFLVFAYFYFFLTTDTSQNLWVRSQLF